MFASIRSIINIKMVFIICIGLLTALSPVMSQKILKTDSGQKILIAKDGSWSIVKFNETINKDGIIVSDTNTNLDAFEAPSAGKYPLTVDQSAQLNYVLKSFQSDEAQLLVNREFFQDNLDLLNTQRRQAKKDKNKEEQLRIEAQIETIKLSLDNTTRDYRKSSKLIASANDLLKGKVKNRDKQIAKLVLANEMPINENSGMGGSVEAKKDILKKEDSLSIMDEQEQDIVTQTRQSNYPKSFKVQKKKYPREKYECELEFDGYDEVLRADKKEVKSEFFFGHSQEKMKPYFKNDDFITCNANVSKVGKKYYITLRLRVKSKDAKKTYGMLRSKETIRFEMVNGNKVYCTSMIQDAGTIEAYTGNTLYTGIYQIAKDDLKILKNEYLDNIGVIWSSGYEEYNIFNVDFLKNQLKCLEK